MTGPCGVDAPAADSPRTIGDPFRAFAAAQQGDEDRVITLVADMSDDDLAQLRRTLRLLTGFVEPVSLLRALARPDPSGPLVGSEPRGDTSR